MDTLVVCKTCGKAKNWGEAKSDGWLIGYRKGNCNWVMVIRCPEHITKYAIRQVK